MLLAAAQNHQGSGPTALILAGIAIAAVGLLIELRPQWFYRRSLLDLDKPMPGWVIPWNRIFGVVVIGLGLALFVVGLSRL